MTINKLAVTGLASIAIVAVTAAPALACDHNHKPVQKPAVHKTVVTHKDTDHQKDCDHDKKVVVKKVVEHKTNTPKTNCDHQPVVQPKPVVHHDNHKDCDHKPVVHKPGKGGVTPTPSPVPQPQKPAVLSATTQPMPTTLPQTGSEDLGLLIGLPFAAAGAGIYLRALRRK